MTSRLTGAEAWSLLALSAACVGIIINTFHGNGEPLIASLAFSGIAFAFAFSLIRWLGETFMRTNLKGRDMSKLKKPEIPETMGAICAVVYLLVIIVFIPFPFYKDIVAATSRGGNREIVVEREHVENGRVLHRFPHSKLASYLSAILSLQSVVLLGIGDDLFDIRWRHKFFIPAFAAIPVLVVYFVDYGVTNVVVPVQLEPYLGNMVDLGWIYYAYMAAIAIFCPNSINILAGINGIEVSQSIVIGFLLLANDVLSLYTAPSSPTPHPATDPHLFSIYLLLPFIGVSIALWWHNWYPAKVFVGDTYCYFAGMVFAIVGILGHFSKTLLLLFVPQIFNFVYSAPQLFRLIPCPRHRLPRFNSRSGLLEPSVTQWQQPPSRPVAGLLSLLDLLPVPLVKLERNGKGEIVESTNFTILNLWLVWFGPKREDRLAIELLVMQTFCGLFGLLDAAKVLSAGGRTHLMSPVMAAAAAIVGILADVRKLADGNATPAKAPPKMNYTQPRANSDTASSSGGQPKFTTLKGTAAPMESGNVDTNAIISKQFLKTRKRTGRGLAPFFALGFHEVMVLATVAHANLRHWHFGITCIIAPSYADVFFNNTFKNGMLTLAITVQSTLEKVTKEAKAGSEIEVDLLNQEMKDAWGEKLADFEVEEFRKHCFVNGFDDIGLTMQMEDPIGKFESRRTMNTPCLNGSGYLKRGNTSGSVKLEAVPVPKGNRAEEIDEPLEG